MHTKEFNLNPMWPKDRMSWNEQLRLSASSIPKLKEAALVSPEPHK